MNSKKQLEPKLLVETRQKWCGAFFLAARSLNDPRASFTTGELALLGRPASYNTGDAPAARLCEVAGIVLEAEEFRVLRENLQTSTGYRKEVLD